MFLCPNDREVDPTTPGRFDRNNELYWYYMGNFPSYGMNVTYLNTPRMDPIYGPDYDSKSATSFGSPADTVLFAEAAAKDYPLPRGGTFTTAVGYYRVLPPSGGPNAFGGYTTSAAWSNFPSSSTRSRGQIYGRFDNRIAIVGWLDGHVKVTPVVKLNPGGANVEEQDRYFNGRGQ
jgi:prepilin-type processing-associated H-X9-DG protein